MKMVVYCEVCGRLILDKNKSAKYCKECWKVVDKAYMRGYMKNYARLRRI